jgi:tripartite-type tricarboxylate transporter receptor subunit TctC
VISRASIAFASFVIAAVLSPLPAAAAQTPAFPVKPVRVISASAPGGGTDIIARHVAQGLSELWLQQVVVDNRAGGAGTIATDLVAKAAADGYTLLVQSFGVAYVGAMRKDLPFDVQRDLQPVAALASQPSLLAVHISVPAQTVAEFVQIAKAKPGQLQYGTTGAGGASHLGTELLARAAGIRLTPVPYKGIAPAFTALLGGEIQLALVPVSTALPQVKAGRIRALGVTGAARSPLMPDVPSMREAGVADYEFDVWYGLFAPAKTARAISSGINNTVNRVLQQPELRQRMTAAGIEPLGGTQPQFEKFFAAEVVKWSKLVTDAGLKAD